MGTEQKTILIVEDEKDTSDALKEALSNEGYEVLTEYDGEKGLSTALEKKPDLILLDVIMPKLTGLEMLKELRKDPWGKNVDVIIMTVLDDMQSVAEAVEHGSEYLVKSDMGLADIVTRAKARLEAGA